MATGLMSKRKFIIVSNRLPVSVTKVNGKLIFTPSSGGLATAMSSLDIKNKLWIGWPGIANEELTTRDKLLITLKLKSLGCSPVFLNRAQIEKFYDGFCNETIWPLFHYFQSYAVYNKEYWQAYESVNQTFAKAVAKQANKTASIWIHDYHLMILPKMLRSTLPASTIGFFLHIPFPSYELFRVLPERRKILEGLLGADLVGFHIYDYARHFLVSARRILGIETGPGSITVGDRVIKVDAFPIGIDYEKFANAARDKGVVAEIKKLDKLYRGKKIILSVDRLDYSKGIMKRLQAYKKFLFDYPEQAKKVVLLIVAVPSRTDVPVYRELRDNIEKQVSRINGAYGTVDWMPISYQFRHLPYEQIAALFSRADVALLTPLRDGMNLVAKEYVASKQNSSGVLILSEMTGAVDELPEAMRINPNDIDEISRSIEEALKIPKRTRDASMKSMQQRLKQYTVKRWGTDFLSELEQSKQTQALQSKKLLTDRLERRIIWSWLRAKRRLVMLDYDGTLRGFVPTHKARLAKPPEQLVKLVTDLASRRGTLLCIVSGRPRSVLEAWFGNLPIALAAEHGAWIRYRGEWSQQSASIRDQSKVIIPILERYAERTPGAIIEQKDFSIVWHYRKVPVELAHARNASLEYELERALKNTEFEIFRGSKIIEIKHKDVHKGSVAEDLQAIHKPDFILGIGDDYTDEDMFRALPQKAYSIKVGLGETNARYQVVGVDDVLKFLKKLL